MRRERFLIAILWISTVLLLALWFFNMWFGFNLFIAAHWQYLSELQVANSVEPKFYTSVAAFVITGLAGLYLLIVPWHRRVRMRPVSNIGFKGSASVPTSAAAVPEVPIMTRPPKLNLNNHFVPVRRDPPVVQSAPAPLPAPMPARAAPPAAAAAPQTASPELVYEIRRLLDGAGFMTKTPPTIGDVKLDFWAIGPDEALVIGLILDEADEITASEGGDSVWRAGGRSYLSPVWQLTSATQRLEALFIEILDPELTINVLPFVFIKGRVANKDSVARVWDALGVKVFDDMKVLAEFLDGHRPGEMDETARGNYEAFTEFADTVASYFGGGA